MEDQNWNQVEEWMERFGDRILRLVYLIVNDYHQAEEITQEVFIRAYRGLDSFRKDASPYTWLYRIAVNLSRSHIQRKSRFKFLPLIQEAFRGYGLAGESEPLDERVLRAVTGKKVRDCVAQLPIHYREVILLFYFEDMKISDVAKVLQQSEGTVKSRLSRGRKALEKIMRREGLEGETAGVL